MRQLKFRAYIRSLQWMVQVERICFDIGTIEVDLTDGNGDTSEYYFDEVELMQYTGLKDKNGVEIYDGDIMYDDYRESNGVVAFSNGKYTFDWENISEDLSEACGDTQIIGNIHENPELLKEKEDDN